MHVGEAEVATLELVNQPRVVDPQAVENSGLQVVDVYRVFRLHTHGHAPSLVRFPQAHPRTYTSV
jgi:hypothetical protein